MRISFGKYNDLIKEELEVIKNNSFDTDNKLSILPKKEVKAIIGRSPDFSDALMMRCYFDLVYQKSAIKFVFDDVLICDELPGNYSTKLYLIEYLENAQCSVIEYRLVGSDIYLREIYFDVLDIKLMNNTLNKLCDTGVNRCFRDVNSHIAVNVEYYLFTGTNDKETFIQKIKQANSINITSDSKNLIQQFNLFAFRSVRGVVVTELPKLDVNNMMIYSLIPLV